MSDDEDETVYLLGFRMCLYWLMGSCCGDDEIVYISGFRVWLLVNGFLLCGYYLSVLVEKIWCRELIENWLNLFACQSQFDWSEKASMECPTLWYAISHGDDGTFEGCWGHFFECSVLEMVGGNRKDAVVKYLHSMYSTFYAAFIWKTSNNIVLRISFDINTICYRLPINEKICCKNYNCN